MRNPTVLNLLSRRFLVSSRSRRFFSTQPPFTSTCFEETVLVPVGGNGSVSLDIFSPPRGSSTAAAPHPILLYLPPGPRPTQWPESSFYDRLRGIIAQTQRPCTLVAIRYRLDPPSRLFPTPIHDTLAGLDWVLRNLYSPNIQTPSSENELQPQISIYGSFIGATLATTLALTEPRHLHSVNIVNPIVDWVSLDDEPLSLTADGKELLQIRKTLFRRPEYYFDPFVSPVLFLRAPNRDVPLPDGDLASGEDAYLAESEGAVVKRRKALRHFPPTGSDLRVNGHWRMPWMRFWVTGDGDGRQDIFRTQAEEMVRLLRRNYMVNYKGLVNDEQARTRIDFRQVYNIDDVLLP